VIKDGKEYIYTISWKEKKYRLPSPEVVRIKNPRESVAAGVVLEMKMRELYSNTFNQREENGEPCKEPKSADEITTLFNSRIGIAPEIPSNHTLYESIFAFVLMAQYKQERSNIYNKQKKQAEIVAEAVVEVQGAEVLDVAAAGNAEGVDGSAD
jgi:hypothetical protein